MPARFPFIVCVLLFAAVSARADWPQFRGPEGNGHVSPADGAAPIGLPLRWSETENVKWKTPIPYRGWSTPVVLGTQLWLTTATEEGHDFFVICVDADSGKILFNEKMFHADAPESLGNAAGVNCYASPSPVIEPGRVYAHFGSYGTACLDTATFKTVWQRDDLPCQHFRGPGSSPALHGDYLLLTMDGIDQQYVAALDKRTGKTVWRTDRSADWNDLEPDGRPRAGGDFRKGFTSPLLAEFDGQTQLISAGSKAAYAYDPATGKELWKVQFRGHTPAMTAVFGEGLVFVSTGHSPTELLAIRPGGSGNVTDTHIAWKTTRGAPRMPSPVVVGDLLYLLADGGFVTCLEAASGEPVWQERIGGEYSASLLHADGRIYCFSNTGTTTVLKPGRAYEALATSKLDAGFMASAAVSGKAFFLRTKTHLYRIESD